MLYLAVTVMLMLGSVSSAHAISTPALTGTDPVSPGASVTPRVKGVVDGVVTSGVVLNSLRPITRAAEPNNTVRLYTTSSCAPGSQIGIGPVALLEGEGIPVTTPVLTDAVTTFYATQTNEAGTQTSECSQGLEYRQVTTLPSAPTFTGVNPPPPANSNFPRLLGTAPEGTTVLIYANASCAGGEVGSGSAAQFGSEGIQVIVPDNSETTFSAKAAFGEFASPCSTSLVYREETPKPNPDPDPGPGQPGGGGGGNGGGSTPTEPASPRLRTVPGGAANNNTPLITGSAPGAGRIWIYSGPACTSSPIARGTAAEFAAGIPVRVVDNTVATFSAVGLAGDKASKCSDPVAYIEDSLTPRTKITMAPGSKTAKRKAVIRFTDSTGALPGTTFLCSIDNKKWRQCTSPLRLKKLKFKRYTVRVKASDAAGNVEVKGAKRSFKVIHR